MTIGTVRVEPPLVLAPMAGITSSPFRLLCKRAGAGLVCSEMVSSNGLHYSNRKTDRLLHIVAEERPVSIQIFGSDPERMAEAAQRAQQCGADLVDINMGCTVPKVVKTGAGCALMDRPDLVSKILDSVVTAVTIPVTVKLRSRGKGNSLDAVELALLAQDAGVKAVTVHARVGDTRFKSAADWSVISNVKKAVALPVVGNGDVRSPQDAQRMFEETACDAVMVGRAALGDPHLFSRMRFFLETGVLLPMPSAEEQIRTALLHARMLAEREGEKQAVRQMRQHVCWYTRSLPHARELRDAVFKAEGLDELHGILRRHATVHGEGPFAAAFAKQGD